MATTALSLVNAVARIGERLARSPAERALLEKPVEVEAVDVQGLVFRGYGNLEACSYVMLRVTEPRAARAFIRTILPEVTRGEEPEPGPDGSKKRGRKISEERRAALHLAFTHAGLAALGLCDEALAGFSREFIAGMTDEQRSRFLGDTDDSAPEHWQWGGPGTSAVHAVLMVYALNDAALAARLATLRAAYTASGLSELHVLPTSTFGGERRGVEHFGFADGISQPAIEGYHDNATTLHRIKAGEFLLGYVNEYGELTPRPLVPPALDPAGTLPLDVQGSAQRDFGRNGTYLVFRQLKQDVPTFRAVIDTYSRDPDGTANADARDRLAARMVGRWPSGASLVHAPLRDDITKTQDNEFRYHDLDRDGLKCPVGSHVRRANPRDALPPEPGTDASLSINRRHRLIRRGRTYGPPLPEGMTDELDRGLMFVAVNGNITRQFEFIQHSWIADPRFNGLFNEADPIAGAQSDNDFTVPTEPVATRCTGLPRFVTVTGGAYFFLPGVRALRYLAELAP